MSSTLSIKIYFIFYQRWKLIFCVFLGVSADYPISFKTQIVQYKDLLPANREINKILLLIFWQIKKSDYT